MPNLPSLDALLAEYGPGSKLAAKAGDPLLFSERIRAGLAALDPLRGSLAEWAEVAPAGGDAGDAGGPPPGPDGNPPPTTDALLAAALAAAVAAVDADFGVLEERVLVANAADGFAPPGSPSEIGRLFAPMVAVAAALEAALPDLRPLVPVPSNPAANNVNYAAAQERLVALQAQVAALAGVGAAEHAARTAGVYRAGIKQALRGFK